MARKSAPVVLIVVLQYLFLFVGGRHICDEPTVTSEIAETNNTLITDVPEFVEPNPQTASTVGTTASMGMMETQCECVVFNTEFPTENNIPILIHVPINVGCHCDSTAEENCSKLCAGIAEAAQERGPQLMCAFLGHYNKLEASLHSRICGAKQWTYAGFTKEICCHKHQVIDCNDLQAIMDEEDTQTGNQL